MEQDHNQDSNLAQSDDDRRSFLKTCGRFAATVPPVMMVLLSTSLSSKAIARSTGDTGRGGHDTGRPKVDKGLPSVDKNGPKVDKNKPSADRGQKRGG